MAISGSLALDDSYRAEPSQNRVAVLSAPRKTLVNKRPQPHCGPEDVLIRLEGCGICASSLPVWEGRPWFDYPMSAGSPGHEGWGFIEAVGDAVDNLEPGQRVTCLGDAAFADVMATPAKHVVPLPAALDGTPFPGEAVGCAMNIFRRADIQPGQSVAIIGTGFLGLLLTQLSVAAGATVYAISRRASARALAEQCGAKASFDSEDWWGNAQRIVERTGGRGCDRVIEVTGLQFALSAATEMIAEYGKLVVAGFHQDGLRQVNMQTWNWRALDVINAHERDPARYIQGMEAGVQATLEGRITPQAFLTHRFNLDQLDRAFQMMVDRPNGFIKGWVAL